MLRFALCLAAIVATVTVRAEDKIDSEKLVGSWKLTKSEVAPKGATAIITYAKDGTAKAEIEFDGKKLNLEAKYKVEGNKLLVTHKKGDKEEVDTDTIVKLTDTVLITKNKDGKTDEFERLKK